MAACENTGKAESIQLDSKCLSEEPDAAQRIESDVSRTSAALPKATTVSKLICTRPAISVADLVKVLFVLMASTASFSIVSIACRSSDDICDCARVALAQMMDSRDVRRFNTKGINTEAYFSFSTFFSNGACTAFKDSVPATIST